MGVFVLDGGFLTTIQDLGRWGFQKDGVSVGGVMDAFASRLANFLVGNDESEAVLEMTMIGPALRFEMEAVVAVCGGEFSCQLNDQPAPLWQPLSVKPGDVLSIGPCHHGYRGYIAFSGGLQVPLVLSSRSTYIKAAIGGLNGRPLRKGDVLSLQPPRRVPMRRFDWGIAYRARSYIYGGEKIVRAIAGPEHHMFTAESVQRFFTTAYEVTTQSDRMGYRLRGAELKRHTDREMLSEAVAFGTVQVPTSGEPIVLMADRQTTGGYPRIAQVLSVDLPILAQARPGDRIRFQKASWQEAERLYIEREHEMRQWKAVIQQKWRDTGGTN